jgi:hypothetical protein
LAEVLQPLALRRDDGRLRRPGPDLPDAGPVRVDGERLLDPIAPAGQAIGEDEAGVHGHRGVGGLAGENLPAGGPAVAIERDSRSRVEGRGEMVPGIERKPDVGAALHPRPADGELQAEIAFGIDAEQVPGLAVLLLVDESAPRPGIGLDGRPDLDRERVAEAGRQGRGPDDGRCLPVEAQPRSRYAEHE